MTAKGRLHVYRWADPNLEMDEDEAKEIVGAGAGPHTGQTS